MGIDIYTYIIVGAEIEKKQRMETVTKYDEDSGEAYDKLIQHDYWTFVGMDTELDVKYDEDTGETIYAYKDFQTYFPFFESDSHIGVFGLLVAESDSNRSNKFVKELDYAYLTTAIERFRSEYGWKPQVFMLKYTSY